MPRPAKAYTQTNGCNDLFVNRGLTIASYDDAIDNRDDSAEHDSWNDIDKNSNNLERVVRLLTILQRLLNLQP